MSEVTANRLDGRITAFDLLAYPLPLKLFGVEGELLIQIVEVTHEVAEGAILVRYSNGMFSRFDKDTPLWTTEIFRDPGFMEELGKL